ncbi:MAG: hypothetical protein JWP21_2360 [Tardiphaga sp.]|nr:hypothetical protein [Tardiphaga sp.]MDB5548913.1 hypothetical protein [Tardiphaga sp.]
MPAFTFEKISSPARASTESATINGNSQHDTGKRSRGLIAGMLDRFTAARIAREENDQTSTPPHKRPPPD